MKYLQAALQKAIKLRNSLFGERLRFPDPADFSRTVTPGPPVRPYSQAPVVDVPCILCGRREHLRVIHEQVPRIDTRSRVVQCPDCALVFLSPRLASIGDSWWNDIAYLVDCLLPGLQDSGRLSRDLVLNLDDNDAYQAALLAAVEPVRASGGGATLLDVGCSLGTLVLAASRAGWETRGLEPSRIVATYGSSALGVGIDVGTIGEIPVQQGRYACVTMTEALEHTFDPLAAAKSIIRALRPGGVLFLSVPNFDTRSYRSAGVNWEKFVTDHYFHFTGETLAAVLFAAGFRSVALQSDQTIPYAKLRHADLMQRLRDGKKNSPMWLGSVRDLDGLYAWALK